MSRELFWDNLSEEDKVWLRSWDRADEIPADSVPEDIPLEGEPTVDDYESWKVGELRQALEEAGLDTTGVKAELIARLRAADAEGE